MDRETIGLDRARLLELLGPVPVERGGSGGGGMGGIEGSGGMGGIEGSGGGGIEGSGGIGMGGSGGIGMGVSGGIGMGGSGVMGGSGGSGAAGQGTRDDSDGDGYRGQDQDIDPDRGWDWGRGGNDRDTVDRDKDRDRDRDRDRDKDDIYGDRDRYRDGDRDRDSDDALDGITILPSYSYQHINKASNTPRNEQGISPVPQNPGEWQRHTTGFGSKIMSKMGFKRNEGLGKFGQGIAVPVEGLAKTQGQSLGFIGDEGEKGQGGEGRVGGGSGGGRGQGQGQGQTQGQAQGQRQGLGQGGQGLGMDRGAAIRMDIVSKFNAGHKKNPPKKAKAPTAPIAPKTDVFDFLNMTSYTMDSIKTPAVAKPVKRAKKLGIKNVDKFF